MGWGEMFALGDIKREMEEANEIARDKLESSKESIRVEFVRELINEGIILPEYDWQSEAFKNELEAITLDWFERHPETKRGTGEFDKKYPEKAKGLDLLWEMAQKGRIKPDEYIALYRGIYNF